MAIKLHQTVKIEPRHQSELTTATKLPNIKEAKYGGNKCEQFTSDNGLSFISDNPQCQIVDSQSKSPATFTAVVALPGLFLASNQILSNSTRWLYQNAIRQVNFIYTC